MTTLKSRPDTNLHEVERWANLIGGAGLIGYALVRRDKAGAGLALLGGALAYRGASGHCDVYQALGINTATSRPGVPYELGVRVDHEIRISRPTEELYQFWRKFENLPRFMEHLESVTERSDGTSHWVARGPAGWNVEWDAEIVNEIPNQVIGWRSLPGSQVDNGGSVRFEEAPDGRTAVRVSLQYNPPAGTIGRWVARMFGEDPQRTIREDLERFKELMETGVLATRSKTSDESNWGKRDRRTRKTDNVNESSEESFPASDSPSWTPETV